ncbi:NUDIX hydrolase [Evansella sp. AB-rgal1]|uniref:NUDIX hydrolase n=1 Tax=Evansella sp. AB-rgal1 TaxID=3242696 RepID=UPI00359D5103
MMTWRESIENYAAWNEQEEKDKEITLSCLETYSNVLTRENELVHITSSAFVVNKTRDKALMVHHNIYNSWSWTGGHADGEEDLLFVAMKEVKEETGITYVKPVSEDIISLDILPVFGHQKRGKYVAPHLHINVAYLLEADEHEPLVVKPDENSNVQWIPLAELDSYSDEPHMKEVYKKIIERTV